MCSSDLIEMLKTEKACVERQDRKPHCNRYCESCDLCMPIEKVLEGYELAIQALEQMKEGHWISEGYYADGSNVIAFRCSECGNHILEYDTGAYNFCPVCGARMGVE